MEKNIAFFVSGTVFLVVLLVVLNYFGLLFVSLASIVAGFFFFGMALPELMKGMKYSHTIWLPVGVILAGFLGFSVVFSSHAIPLLTSFNWCPKAPCLPFGFYFVGFVLGCAANWASYFLMGEEINLIEGE